MKSGAPSALALKGIKNLSDAQQHLLDVYADFLAYQYSAQALLSAKELERCKQESRYLKRVVLRQNYEIAYLHHRINGLMESQRAPVPEKIDQALQTDRDATAALVYQLQNQIYDLRRHAGITKNSSNVMLTSNNESSATRRQELLDYCEIDAVINE